MHKEIRNTLAYIVVATFVMITAVWQAQVSAKHDLEARHRALPPPPKTKHAIRPAPQIFAGDVVADYIARCEKGMTDREIGWILEDFHNANLDAECPGYRSMHTGPPTSSELEQFLAYITRQARWYRDTLVDGLRLSSEQTIHLSRSLAATVEKSRPQLGGITTDGEWAPSTKKDNKDGEWTPSRNDFSSHLALPRPWKLCPLNPQQEKLTWKRWWEPMKTGGNHDLEFPEHSDMREVSAKTPGLRFLMSSPPWEFENDPQSPLFLSEGEFIFPFIEKQKFLPIAGDRDPFVEISPDEPALLLPNLRRLHPAQLKTLLLLAPDMSSKIQQALDNESR